MMTKPWLFGLIACVPTAWLGCSSSSPAVSDETVDDAGSDVGSDGSINKSDSGDGATRDADAAARDVGNDGDAGIFTGPPPPEAGCDPAATWVAGMLIAASTANDDLLDAVTPDELTIAWTAGPPASKIVYYADRTSTSNVFGAAQNLGTGNFVTDRVALSPDGLRIIVVNADALGFSEATRASRTGGGSTFGAPATGGFTNINAATPGGESVGDPIVGSSDTSFYYSLYGGSSTATIYRSLRLLPTDAWGEGAALNVASGLLEVGSQRRRPTGISSDGRTLFFFDEVSSTERAAWINESTGSFDSFVDLGSRTWAAPSSTCATLYYSSAGASSIDLFSATH